MLATMQQFVDRTTDDKRIKYVIRKYIKQIYSSPLVFLVVGESRELGGGGVEKNQCVGRHVDIWIYYAQQMTEMILTY